jgi:mannose-1-phosphate guanylyltransferase
MTAIHPVILCGGSGTRLWPRSRKARAQAVPAAGGGETLFEATLDRCGDPTLFAAPTVVAGAQHLCHVEAQLGGRPDANIIVEPAAKNTAAAIALAACAAARRRGDAGLPERSSHRR